MARLASASLITGLTFLACQGVAHADDEHEWRKETGEAHGSQVASSEWLPIMLGASAGVIVGGLTGSAFDDSQPPVVGGLAGGAIGGFTGGAGGAWLIRSIRERDTRVAGTLTGLGLGAGVGFIVWNGVNPEGRGLETVGKWAALAVFPAVGAVVGWKLAVTWGGKASKEAPPSPTAAFAPVVAPVIGPHGGATGMSVGVDAIF